jgi:hypothetical protein
MRRSNNSKKNAAGNGANLTGSARSFATLRDTPRFAIALGNRGLARIEFARALDEQNDKIFSFLAALKDLKGALASDAVWDADYPEARAATDHFSLPGYRAPLDEPPQFIAWFNQLKQEFSAARTLLFEADGGMSAHYSDRKLWLADTLDYSVFGFSLEKMRLAFRVAYGLLDKVAGFVNAYFKLQEPPDRVNFRNVWLTKDRKSVRAEFTEHPNWPLRGLYWLAFDILEKKNGDDPDAISPEAEDLYQLRNALEHRCLSLHELLVDKEIPSILERTTVTHFQERTLLMLRLARSSLIYLSMAVGAEERLRARSDKGRHVPMTLPTYRGHLR